MFEFPLVMNIYPIMRETSEYAGGNKVSVHLSCSIAIEESGRIENVSLASQFLFLSFHAV